MTDRPDAPSDRIFLSPPYLNGLELNSIRDAIASRYIAPTGPQVDAFEKNLAELTGRKFVVAVASGTAAMHLALHALGIAPQDLVIASTLTFIGSVAPIRYLNATPVFVDSAPETWNMDPLLLEQAINRLNRRPTAVIPTDIYGQCADYDAIGAICKKNGIPLIIDAAESLGATYKNDYAGSGGDIAILSFNGNKIVTTSGGGALLTDDEGIARHARKFAQQAREPLPHYEHLDIGYNYRLSNILAAIGTAQLQDLDWRVKKKRDLFNRYGDLLASTPGITFMPEARYGKSNRWLSVCLVDQNVFGANRETIRQKLALENIESRPVWKPMHLQPVFKAARTIGGSVAEMLFQQGLCLPSGLNLSADDQRRIVRIVLQCRR
jgi:dTDP-4-amino-4,6-dideoxygalactose transaminase